MADVGTTVLLGAGFSQSLGFPGTFDLTQEVRGIQVPTLSDNLPKPLAKAPLADMLWRMISSYYSNPNFETMLHAIEAMLSVQSGVVGVNLPDEVKPIVNAFMDVTPRWSPLAASLELRRLASRITSTVAGALVQRRTELDFSTGHFVQNRDTLNQIRADGPLNFVNLNYDDGMYAMFPDAVDGFSIKAENYYSFNYPSLLDRGERDLILHLHGSVLYGFEPLTAYGLDDTTDEELARYQARRGLVKFETTGDASVSWSVNDDIGSQAGERVLVGPIVTGLRKTEKTLYGPYGYYLHTFIECLLRSQRLIIFGYGGRDAYINHWLYQWLLQHGTSARCAIVTRSSSLMDGPAPSLLDFVARACREDNPTANDWNPALDQKAIIEEALAEGITARGRCLLIAGEGLPLADDQVQRMRLFLSN